MFKNVRESIRLRIYTLRHFKFVYISKYIGGSISSMSSRDSDTSLREHGREKISVGQGSSVGRNWGLSVTRQKDDILKQ